MIRIFQSWGDVLLVLAVLRLLDLIWPARPTIGSVILLFVGAIVAYYIEWRRNG